MDGWVNATPVASIAPNQCVVVSIGGIDVAVFNIAGEFLAIEDQCSHEESTLSDGEVDGETIICPRHGAKFALRTGEALSAPAYEPVATFRVRVVNGMVQVRDDH